MESIQKIEKIKTAVILGAGNVAWHLGHVLGNNGIKILQVCSRTPSHGKSLAESLNSRSISSVENIDRSSDLFLLAVSDDVIVDVADSLGFLQSGILIHTSGSVPMQVLSSYAADYGVVYPLQTFTKSKNIDFTKVPLLIEGCNNNVYEKLRSLSAGLSEHVYSMNSHDRFIMHCAAVISSNFSNYLLLLAEKIIKENSLSFELLKPLMIETISKAFATGPSDAQTGPARRGNKKIMDEHLILLESWPEIQRIYKLLSESIMQHYSEYEN